MNTLKIDAMIGLLLKKGGLIMNRFLYLILTFSLLASSLAGCAGQKAPVSLTPVSVVLKWVHQGQFAGFYVAKEKGFYADEGLDVTLMPGGPGINVVQTVLSGEAQFGDTRPENLIGSRTQGDPVKAVAVIARDNPYVLVALPESGITKPTDFVGKVIMPDFGGNRSELQFLAMIKRAGVSLEDMTIVPYNADYSPFFNGEVDVIPSVWNGDLVKIKQTRPDVTLIWPSDYGVRFYADTLFTTDEFIANNPDVVRGFLRATLKGHQYTIDHPEEAAELTLRYTQDDALETHLGMINASTPLIYTGEDEIGWMRSEVWQQMQDILFLEGVIQQKFNIADVFENKFLEEIYSK